MTDIKNDDISRFRHPDVLARPLPRGSIWLAGASAMTDNDPFNAQHDNNAVTLGVDAVLTF
jgi:hypothetical protein